MPVGAEIAPQPERARLFFALWPDEVTRACMSQHAVRLAAKGGGRVVGPAALHLTLVFVGAVPASALSAVCAAAGEAQSTPFTLILDRIGAWRANGIGWLAPGAIPQAAIDLSESLRSALRARGLPFDAKPFKAHVTLVRKLSRPVAGATVGEIEWPVHEFALMRSRLAASGANYERVASWSLENRAS